MVSSPKLSYSSQEPHSKLINLRELLLTFYLSLFYKVYWQIHIYWILYKIHSARLSNYIIEWQIHHLHGLDFIPSQATNHPRLSMYFYQIYNFPFVIIFNLKLIFLEVQINIHLYFGVIKVSFCYFDEKMLV